MVASLSIRDFIKIKLFEFRKERAIRKAQKYADTYRRKYIVLVSAGRPQVVSIQGIKQLIRQRRFIKGFDAAKAREIAIFEAVPHKR